MKRIFAITMILATLALLASGTLALGNGLQWADVVDSASGDHYGAYILGYVSKNCGDTDGFNPYTDGTMHIWSFDQQDTTGRWLDDHMVTDGKSNYMVEFACAGDALVGGAYPAEIGAYAFLVPMDVTAQVNEEQAIQAQSQ